MELKNLAGLGFAVLCAFFFAINGVVIKKVKSVTALKVSFWRCCMQMVWIMPICYYRWEYNQWSTNDLFWSGRGLSALLFQFYKCIFLLAAEGIPKIGNNEHDTKERGFISEILPISLAICMWCYDCNDLCLSSVWSATNWWCCWWVDYCFFQYKFLNIMNVVYMQF